MHKAGHDIVISLPAEPSEGLVQHRLKTPHKNRTVLPKKKRIRFPKIIAFRSPQIRSLLPWFPRTRA